MYACTFRDTPKHSDMQSSVRCLRKRFLTKEEKVAYQKLQEERKREARAKALQESRIRKAKAKRERELDKKRAQLKLKYNMSQCEPEFRHVVQQWAKDKTTAKVNRFFELLEEVKCPMEPCYNPKKLDRAEKVLRMNKCGYQKLSYNLNLPDAILGCDFWNNEYQRQYDRAHELDIWLYQMA